MMSNRGKWPVRTLGTKRSFITAIEPFIVQTFLTLLKCPNYILFSTLTRLKARSRPTDRAKLHPRDHNDGAPSSAEGIVAETATSGFY
ncbi:hypothetical protein [Altericista sp. CCNU0014]|uniref:hypothetical protein n=1 Tax=Altericista sp. CCNU0014 TaxID=3082949 RepID=UPI00384A8E1A